MTQSTSKSASLTPSIAVRLSQGWVGLCALLAVLAPFIANQLPLKMTVLATADTAQITSSPLLENLGPVSALLPFCALMLLLGLVLRRRVFAGLRFACVLAAAALGAALIAESLAHWSTTAAAPAWLLQIKHSGSLPVAAPIALCALFFPPACFVPCFRLTRRLAAVISVAALCAAAMWLWWPKAIILTDHRAREARAEVVCTYTLVPFSPGIGFAIGRPLAPGESLTGTFFLDLIKSLGDRPLSRDDLPSIKDRVMNATPEPIKPAAAKAFDSAAVSTFNRKPAPLPKDLSAAFEMAMMASGKPTPASVKQAFSAGPDLNQQLDPTDFANLSVVVRAFPGLSPAQRERALQRLARVSSSRPSSTYAQAAAEMANAAGPLAVLGTDKRGRDVLGCLIHGTRQALVVGLGATAIAVGLGVLIGSIMGYRGGWFDTLMQRVIEIDRSIPNLLMVLVLSAVLPRSTFSTIAVLGLLGWSNFAQLVRAEFLRVRELDFVHAARAAGVGPLSLVTRHMLPSALSGVTVHAAFFVGVAILQESVLSYLNLGAPGTGSWGELLSGAWSVGAFLWWLALFPGLCMFLTILAANTLAEHLRSSLNVRESRG